MVIGFTQGPQIPLGLAIELNKRIGKYNKGKIPSEIIRIRIGIHSGPVFIVNDILNNRWDLESLLQDELWISAKMVTY